MASRNVPAQHPLLDPLASGSLIRSAEPPADPRARRAAPGLVLAWLRVVRISRPARTPASQLLTPRPLGQDSTIPMTHFADTAAKPLSGTGQIRCRSTGRLSYCVVMTYGCAWACSLSGLVVCGMRCRRNGHGLRLHFGAWSRAGRQISISRPPPSRLRARMLPPWTTAILCAIDKPKPVPPV